MNFMGASMNLDAMELDLSDGSAIVDGLAGFSLWGK
jgi:hypothetical protein